MPRISIAVSDYVHERLIFLGEIHGKPKSPAAAEIVADWVLQNDATITAFMENVARQRGISLEELERLWLLDGDRKMTED